MKAAFEKAGYEVRSLGYPSTEKSVEDLANDHLAPAIAECQTNRPAKIHFVTHSLGAIVLRQYLSSRPLPNIGRIVMLGPPNQGSEVVDKLGQFTLFEWLNGPAGRELGTGTNSLPRALPVPAADIGIIAGTRSINLILSALIPGPDDGKVSPKSAKLVGMKDFATVPTSHPFLMRDSHVIAMTLSFIRRGSFEPSPPTGPCGPDADIRLR